MNSLSCSAGNAGDVGGMNDADTKARPKNPMVTNPAHAHAASTGFLGRPFVLSFPTVAPAAPTRAPPAAKVGRRMLTIHRRFLPGVASRLSNENARVDGQCHTSHV